MEEKETSDKEFQDTFIKNMPFTIKFGDGNSEKAEKIETDDEKKDQADDEAGLDEWAEKIYRAADDIWRKEIVKLCTFERTEGEPRKEFLNRMNGKKFGKFISTFTPKKEDGSFIYHFVYIRLGNYELIEPNYLPVKKHTENVKNFLREQKENYPEIVQEIIMKISTIPIIARMIRGKVLYPEMEEMENKISELEEKLKKKDNQLRSSLDTLIHLVSGIGSELYKANPCIYAIMNELGKK